MAPTAVVLAPPPPPGLQEATKSSTSQWQDHLEELFKRAKDRFPDVVWELTGEGGVEEVWGHKAIVYARAPPSFQNRYFSFRPSTPPVDTTSALSLDVPPSILSRTPSPVQCQIPLRLTTSINPTLFSNELEYLYTSQGFGEAFEFLFDSSDGEEHDDPESMRIDKLRKDLVFMWRSRLYSDVRIALTGNFSSSHENTTAIFSSHRFILVSRSPYFRNALLDWPSTPSTTLNLPSPPFTPASLHFTLGFIYTGTLIFSHRSYDLSTAFAILRSALYLAMPSLQDEIQARIAQEMLHGLFHAFLPFSEYERITGGKWGTGGCRCRQCARRAPRVLEFALSEDVKNAHLERGARRALVGLFGEGWCTSEFASLTPKLRESLLKGLGKRTTPLNVFPLLFAAEHALVKIGTIIEPWGDTVRDMLVAARKAIDETICKESEACFESAEWMEVMEGDGVRFEDGERVEWVMKSVMRGVKEVWAAPLYQTLVSSILLRPHPTEANAPLLSATSHIRVQVEQTRLELLKWIGKRWIAIRQERGFDPLDGWALKEISDHIEVPIEDLLNPAPPSYSSNTSSPRNTPNFRTKQHLRPISTHPHTSRVDAESDVASSMRDAGSSVRDIANSTRANLFAKNLPSKHGSSASSVRSVSTVGTVGGGARRVTNPTSSDVVTPARRVMLDATRGVDPKDGDRPDSKLTPRSPSMISPLPDSRTPSPSPPSIVEPENNYYEEDEENHGDDYDDDEQEGPVLGSDDRHLDGDGDEKSIMITAPTSPVTPLTTPLKKTLITKASLASSRTGSRPKSPASSVRSHASTIRRSGVSGVVTSRTGGLQAAAPRPNSRGSTRTTATTNSRTSTNTRMTTSGAAARTRLGANTKANTRSTSTISTTSTRPMSSLSTASTHSRRSPTSSQSMSRPESTHSNANSRPTSSVSNTDTATNESFRTASSGSNVGLSTPVVRSRKISASSTRTNSTSTMASVKTAGTSPRPKSTVSVAAAPRVRRVSGSSITSVAGAKGPAMKRPPPVPVTSPTKSLPVGKGVKRTTLIVGGKSGAATLARQGKPISEVAEKDPAPISKGVQGHSLKAAEGQNTLQDDDLAKNAEVEAPMNSDSDEKVLGDSPMDTDCHVLPPSPSISTSTIAKAPIKKPVSNPLPNATTDISNEHHKKSGSSASSASVATLKRKGSSDTITTKVRASGSSIGSGASIKPAAAGTSTQETRYSGPKQPTLSNGHNEPVPRGATLEIGIPCIISSKRKRFKAYARYIGEVEGETGPWVGVEVPMPVGESWGGDYHRVNGDRSEDRQWNDGTWGGIRYFEIGGVGGSEWDYSGEDRAARRRRIDAGSVGGAVWGREVSRGVLKRDGDQMSVGGERKTKRMRSVSPAVSDTSGVESRGLFVRPQQVLYVVDAVGSDL